MLNLSAIVAAAAVRRRKASPSPVFPFLVSERGVFIDRPKFLFKSSSFLVLYALF